MQAAVAELVYDEPLRIPGELLTSTADPVEPVHLITQLPRHMARLRPVPAARHSSSATFMHTDLHNCKNVLLRQDATCRALEPPYNVPYQVLSRRQKTLQLLVRGKLVTVFAERVKPAYVFNEYDHFELSGQHNPSASTSTSGHIATALQLRRLRVPAATYAYPHA
jgi:hypothetical protein